MTKDELIAKIKSASNQDLVDIVLDNLVHDCKDREAQHIANDGLEEQVEYLLENMAEDDLFDELAECFEE